MLTEIKTGERKNKKNKNQVVAKEIFLIFNKFNIVY